MSMTLEESDARVAREDNLANSVIFKKSRNGGRKVGGVNLSPEMRNLIGAAAVIDGSFKKTAETFGVDERSVSHYAKGRTSQDMPVKQESKEAVAEMVEKAGTVVETVKEKALSRLASLFDGPINEENLSTLKPREAISAAKDLASVIDRVTPKQGENTSKLQVVIFAPRVREEKEYETVDIDARVIS